MPIPTPRKGQSREAFISQCMHSIGNEYDDKKQALAICYQRYADKKAKASLIFEHGNDETIYVDSQVMLPEPLIAKIASFPQSAPGRYSVNVTLKNGTIIAGEVRDGIDFHSDADLDDVITDDIVDVSMNDIS